MKPLTLNIRRFNSAPKKTALKRMLESIGPSVLVIAQNDTSLPMTTFP